MKSQAPEKTIGNETPVAVEPGVSGRELTPSVDIHEDAEGLTLQADLPGVLPASIEVSFEDRELRLEARMKPRAARNGKPLLEEFESGSYFRSFRVSEVIDASRIAASYRDGVLSLRLPKVEAVKPRRISVTAV